MCYFEAASWHFAPETARAQPQKPNPKHNLQCTSKHKITKKVLRGCYFQVISGNTPQMTEAAWQRTSKYESSVQSPPRTAGNAPEYTKRTSNHIANCPANMQLEQGSGKGTLGEGKPEKNRAKMEKQPETNRTANNPDFWTIHTLNAKTHKGMVRQGRREDICRARAKGERDNFF